MEEYANIKLVKATAKRFRRYAQKLASTQSEALDTLIDAHLKLVKEPGQKSKSVQSILERSDTNADRVIALLRKIEKDQIKPMLGMLQVLFGYSSAQEQSGSKKGRSKSGEPKTETDFKKAFAVIDLKEEKLKLAADLELARREIHDLLSKKTEVVRPTLGKPYVKLQVTPEELKTLIAKYKPKT
jgi:hypothetical protein